MAYNHRRKYDRNNNKYKYTEIKEVKVPFKKDPLGLDFPTEIHLNNNESLKLVLKKANKLKENKGQLYARQKVLLELQSILEEWCVMTAVNKYNKDEATLNNTKAKLFAYGSYKLGVHSFGDDIDVLAVGPKFLTRNDFFDGLGGILKQHPGVRNYYDVKSAYVPVMTFTFNGIDIDMVYGQLQSEILDDSWNIYKDENLRNLTNESILSINGPRLAESLLDLVPARKGESEDENTFKLSLRAIRHWAKRRNVYSNKIGYLGGVSWAILVARVCQLYPNATYSQIVQKFFLFYHLWDFKGTLKCILLKEIEYKANYPGIKVWNPNDKTSKNELMHIITPAYPSMNSTHNVCLSTFEKLINIILDIYIGYLYWISYPHTVCMCLV